MSEVDLWMPLYVADYMSSTNRLTTEQHGAYLLLIMDYWKNGRLPDNDQILSQITRLSPDAWGMQRAVLEQFFTISGGQWVHGRIEKELDRAREKKGKAVERAKAAAQARWSQDSDGKKSDKECPKHATSNASDVLEQCPSPSPSPSPNKPSEKPSTDGCADKPRTPAPKAKLTKTDLINDYGLPEDLVVQFLAIRKDKKQTLTPRAMSLLTNEFAKAGLTVHDGVALCCDRSWAGFKASWDWQGVNGVQGKPVKETPQERGERMARERGYQ